MSKDIYLPPPKRFKTTRSSLALAKTIADELGMEMDEAENIARVENYYDDMYRDILKMLELGDDIADLHSGNYSTSQIFAARTSDGKDVVVFDMVFDFCIYYLCLLITIQATFKLEAEELQQLIEDVSVLMHILKNPNQFKVQRERMQHYNVKYPKALMLSHPIGRTMTIFMLCHEIAHCTLGHVSKTSDKQHEFDADMKASEYFARIVDKGALNKETFAYIDPKITFSPLFLFQIFDVYEHWLSMTGYQNTHDSHPPAQLRMKHVEPFFSNIMNEQSNELHQGLTKTIIDTKTFLTRLLDA